MATHPPSQFAALLRRSKFASFDPRIDRVYTSFDGHATRGNFGLKRPLALRRRNAHITVKAVDSREQQTVWQSAEQKNRWIRMWEEVGLTPQVDSGSVWYARIGSTGGEVNLLVDSEFTPTSTTEEVTGSDGEKPRSSTLPNFEDMSRDEFERYLKKMRKLRPAFQAYLAGEQGENSTTLWQHSHHSDSFSHFLHTHAYEQYHSPRPRHIAQQPHRYAGLSYSHSPFVQNIYTTKPQYGRRLTLDDKAANVVSFAGRTSKLSRGDRGEDDQRVTTFRHVAATLYSPPPVVGPPGLNRLEAAVLETSVRVESDLEKPARLNPHIPGSRDYVGHSGNMTIMSSPPSSPGGYASTMQREFTRTDGNIAANNLLTALRASFSV